MFQNRVVVITGGARGIGRCICEESEKAGAKVCKTGLITGENSCIGGGQTRLMIWHNDCDWTYQP